ncbi:uncharacterized protein [Venturia canescens]|uniref:uncharacterized protein isoform X1 n=1 Tax=Venturia canescens TaxID=32260 RepID=UPI001C9CD436|nr:uncharacterized protein LOC122418068 isoform X1 [Venturia canescens]
MSRPIFSRPRTRVYGCNYDKGESYYKPMVDHLDRKYSSRPLFSEPRTSFADEIAARRSDIGSRGDQSAAHSSLRDLDLEYDIPRSRAHRIAGIEDNNNEEETVYDIRGQRSTRRTLADDFANEVAATTRRFKAHTNFGLEESPEVEINKNARLAAKSAFEEAEISFKRRSKLLNDEAFDRMSEEKSALTRWSKLVDDDHLTSAVGSAAAGRAKQTKARLNDLESEMEEMAERQAKRERRSAALRALVNETATSGSEDLLQQQSSVSSKKLTVRAEKHVNF